MTAVESGYAQAFLRASLSRGNVERVAEELPAAGEIVSQYAAFFFDPRITGSKKAELLQEAVGNQADALVSEFLALLARRRHLKYLPGICRQFEKLAEANLGRATVRLRIPYQPGAELQDRLREHLAALGLFSPELKNGVKFEILLDKSLLGGFVAEYGGRSLDASLRTRLNRLH